MSFIECLMVPILCAVIFFPSFFTLPFAIINKITKCNFSSKKRCTLPLMHEDRSSRVLFEVTYPCKVSSVQVDNRLVQLAHK